jgi:AcrR family transcriptional regulator
VTLDDLSRICELAKGTLYLYFPSKAEILGTLAYDVILDLSTRFQQVLDGPGEPCFRLNCMGLQYLEHYRHFRSHTPLVHQAASPVIQEQLTNTLREGIHREQARVIERLTLSVAQVKQAGMFVPELDPLEFALTLAGCSFGLAEMSMQCAPILPLGPEEFVGRGWKLLIGAVTAPGVDPEVFTRVPEGQSCLSTEGIPLAERTSGSR